MVAWLLTRQNLEFAKRTLRSRLLGVSSSHRTEAFAAACGYRTHAALLSDLREFEDSRPAIANLEPRRFVKRLSELGHDAVNTSILSDLARSVDLPLSLWREYGNHDHAENNRWYRECQRRDIPNVYIQLRRKYAKLSWDCISIDPKGEAHLRGQRANKLVDEMFRRYQSLACPDPGKSVFFGSAFAGSIDRLLPEVARNIADELFILLYLPMREQEAL